MVLAGLGVALLPTTAVAGELFSGALRRVDLVGTQPIERRIVAIRRRDAPAPAGAVAHFWQLLDSVDELIPRSGGPPEHESTVSA
jgi:DNA-binding transcriptional LysR family regulator